MDQKSTLPEEAVDARHLSGIVRPADTALPAVAALSSDAALLKDTVHPVDAEHSEDAVSRTVNVQDPEAAWPPAPHSCSRCRRLYWAGALMLLLGAVSVPIAFFTRTPTPSAALSVKTSNPTVTLVNGTGCLKTIGQESPVFAKLQAKNQALLSNRTLSWHSQDGAGSSHLSQYLKYDEEKQELVVHKAGLYYVILQLNLSPVFKNVDHEVRGQVSLVLQPNPVVANLTSSAPLTVHLFPCSSEADLVEGSWSRMIPLKAGHRLSVSLRAYLHGGQEAYKDWQLSQTNITSFVLFLVKPDTSRELC
ncbi:tumor necrosis factor ligand superfamily member 9 [Sigmodon hispidus]